MSQLTTRKAEQIENHFVDLQRERTQRITKKEEELSSEYHPDKRALIQKEINNIRRRMKLTMREWDAWKQDFYDAREHQIATYNAMHRPIDGDHATSPWDEQYQFLHDMPEQNDIKIIGKAGRFMRLFSQRHEVVIRRGSNDTKNTEISACIVDPCLIPDDLAQNLQIVSFTKSDTPNARLRKKMSPHCIANLKQIFIDANPIVEGNNRILILSDGRILYSSEKTSQKENNEEGFRLKAGVYDAYGAERKTYHQQGSTCGEISLLTDIVCDISEFIAVLDKKWRKDTPDYEKQRLIAEARRLSMIWQTHFQACVNNLKVDAEKCFENTENLIDSSGKVNPSASMSKLVRAKNDLWKRAHQDIPAKGKYNWIDQIHLMRERKVHEKKLKKFRIQLQEDAPLLDSIKSESDFYNVLNTIRLDPDDLNDTQITLQPFRSYADHILCHYDEYTLAMDERDIDSAKDALIKIHVIGKCQGFHSFLAHLHQNIILPKWSTVAIAQWNLNQMRAYLETRQIFPHRIVKEYEDIFNEMLGALMRLEEIIKGRENFENDDVFFEELQKYIKQFNIPQMVNELP